MFNEIGGNFWLEPKHQRESKAINLDIKYVSKNEDVLYSSSGRGAITLLLKHIRKTNRKVLIPIYTCDSIIIPFLINNYDIIFFDVNIDLSVNKNSFFSLVEKHQPDVIYVHSYFGFDTLRNIRSEFRRLRDNGITIIEDITHSLFSKTSKDGADLYLASLRKWLPIPDGGVVISISEKFQVDKADIHETYIGKKIAAMSKKHEYIKNPDVKLKNDFLKLFQTAQDLLDSDYNYYEMSNISKTIISETDIDEFCNARQNNYKFLIEHLKSGSWLEPIFKELPEDVVPLYFPVYVKCNREQIQKYLAGKDIYAPIHWPIHSQCKSQQNNNSSYIYQNILSIPCDQRYTLQNLERIITSLNEYRG